MERVKEGNEKGESVCTQCVCGVCHPPCAAGS
jgi:hypothetical protein